MTFESRCDALKVRLLVHIAEIEREAQAARHAAHQACGACAEPMPQSCAPNTGIIEQRLLEASRETSFVTINWYCIARKFLIPIRLMQSWNTSIVYDWATHDDSLLTPSEIAMLDNCDT